MEKEAVLRAVRARIEADLEAAIRAQADAVQGATHEEARPENDKDTRGLEQSYLARGLAARVDELEQAKSAFLSISGARSRVGLGALVVVEDEEGETQVYLVGPAAGGLEVEVEGETVKVITPSSPLGRALVGKGAEDEATVRAPKGVRELVILRVA
ncbi:MAG: GreA/GreB family elongation factor [Deltaproteobacteria bacterium]|nr:GreA/GreB family elongation factor [Deltaproteobacteria bacterium]